jgi:hypothetical protein
LSLWRLPFAVSHLPSAIEETGAKKDTENIGFHSFFYVTLTHGNDRSFSLIQDVAKSHYLQDCSIGSGKSSLLKKETL